MDSEWTLNGQHAYHHQCVQTLQGNVGVCEMPGVSHASGGAGSVVIMSRGIKSDHFWLGRVASDRVRSNEVRSARIYSGQGGSHRVGSSRVVLQWTCVRCRLLGEVGGMRAIKCKLQIKNVTQDANEYKEQRG